MVKMTCVLTFNIKRVIETQILFFPDISQKIRFSSITIGKEMLLINVIVIFKKKKSACSYVFATPS